MQYFICKYNLYHIRGIFIESVEKGEKPKPSIEDSLITHEICEGILAETSRD